MSIAELYMEDCEDYDDSGMLFNKGEYGVLKETDKAMYIELLDKEYNFKQWLPKSQVKIQYPGEKLFIPEWLWDKYN